MRTGRRLGMILHAEGGILAVSDSLDRLVVQVDVSHLDGVGKRIRLEGKAVVLARDFHPIVAAIQYGLVGPAMSEFQFKDLAAAGHAEELVAQADPKDRFLAEQVAN